MTNSLLIRSCWNDPKSVHEFLCRKVSIYEIGWVHQILKDKAKLTFKKTQNVIQQVIYLTFTFLKGVRFERAESWASLGWASQVRASFCSQICIINIYHLLFVRIMNVANGSTHCWTGTPGTRRLGLGDVYWSYGLRGI